VKCGGGIAHFSESDRLVSTHCICLYHMLYVRIYADYEEPAAVVEGFTALHNSQLL